MSFQSDNRSQKNSAVEMLTKRNTEAVEELELTPYEPIVYAIPIEQRDVELNLLKDAVQFQPTLYRQISALATRQELKNYVSEIQEIEARYMEQTVRSVTTENGKTVGEMRSLIEQDGKALEKFISQCSKAVDAGSAELRATIRKLHWKIVGIMIGTSVTSVALSSLACVVFWKLVG